ncbi:MAG: sigma-70 family RNA polymerase sigma factor, partial [Acidobacteriota bacterium]|nr:sigma-70 family RNA polymerase sigma factor [Acidobacteriota bacterium]
MFSQRRNLRQLADEDLMLLVRGGDARAFEVLFDRHGGPAFSLAYRMCGSRARAEDVVQEAFLSLWRAGGRYDQSRGSVRAWLLSVVHNRAIDLFRRESVRPTRRLDEENVAERLAAADLTEAEAERRAEAERVRGALHELPDEQRQVIELSYYGGFTHQQIAELLS